MKTESYSARSLVVCAALLISAWVSGPVFATDDGPRAYWKARAGTQVFSFQFLNLNMQASGAQQFAPGLYLYPNSDTEANVMVASWATHFTLFKTPSSFAVNVAGGSVDAAVDTGAIPPGYLPPDVEPGGWISQSASGFGDPSMQLTMNLFGTPPLISSVDLLNYEPTWTLDAAVMLAVPIGQYESDQVVNMGLNRWYGRVALPFKVHFGRFTPGYMTSLEFTPSVWLFAENDDFVGTKLDNDSMVQLEGHLTHDFTSTFFASLDLLYRAGFQSKIDGVEVGEELDIGDLGFTFNYQVTGNVALRASYSSNVFGDNEVKNSTIRIQFVYGWHRLVENMKKLQHH